MPTSRLPALLLLAGAAAAGCGDDPDDDFVDITVRGDRASLLAARDVGGDWRTLTADANGDVLVPIRGPFEVLGVCEDFGGEVYAYGGGPDDAAIDPFAYDIGCGALDTVDVDVAVTGATGDVYVSIGYLGVRVEPGATARVNATAGVHDVLAVDREAHTVSVRRGVTITAGLRLEVDFSGAVPLVERGVAASAQAFVSSSVITASGDRARFSGAGETSAWTLPPSLVATGDRHTLTVREQDPELPRARSRTVEIDPAATAPVSVTLPPHLTSATATWDGVPSASYVATGTWDDVDLFGYQLDDDIAPLWLFVEYPHAARTPGRITAPDPRGITGWDAAWNVDGAQPYVLDLGLYRKTADGGSESVTWQFDTSPPPADEKRAALDARADAVRARRADARVPW